MITSCRRTRKSNRRERYLFFLCVRAKHYRCMIYLLPTAYTKKTMNSPQSSGRELKTLEWPGMLRAVPGKHLSVWFLPEGNSV